MKISHPALRIITVTALTLFFCFAYLPDLIRVAGYPDGDLGFRTDGSIVTVVAPDSPAARARIHVGDRIDLSRLSPTVRLGVIGGFTTSPGQIVRIQVWRGDRYSPVMLRAVAESTAPALIVTRELAFVLPLLIGLLLVLMRPSPITWGFFLFSLAAGGTPPDAVLARFLPGWNAQVATLELLRGLQTILPKTGLVLFAFSLPRRPLSLWPRVAIATVVMIGIVQAMPFWLHPDRSVYGLVKVNAACELISAVLALSGLLYSYRHVAIRLRQRLHWIAVGFVLWIAINVTDALLWPAYESYWFHSTIDAAQVIFPITVAYAIFRERVVDINFVVSRTLAYGLLTSVIVGVFALVDLFLSRTMEARLSLPVDIVVALILGFFFHGMRNRIDDIIDRVIFRRRHAAETWLAKAAKAVVHVDDPAAISDYLTRLPVQVLDLTGAALYMRHRDGFILERFVGWKHEPDALLATSDPLVTFVSSELACVRVTNLPMRAPPPDRHDTAVLAVPLVFRRELAGFILYGAHEDGADLDADEERALVPLVNNAAATYDHIEAQAIRDENRRLRSLQPVTSRPTTEAVV